MTSASDAPQIPGLTYIADLGHGGFADVYLYRSHAPEREVAVKVLRDKQMSGKLSQQFAEEANTMAALEHPYIVRVYSFGRTSDGRPYIEMAYYPQESLAETVKRQGPFSVPDVLRMGIELASAVETAHRAGLLHRDIKPANVLRDRFGDPALTDFGIASRLHESVDEDASLSIPWAPVEAMFSTESVDQRSDVYSLAATMWHLLVGRSPFEIPGGDNRPTMMMLRARDLPAPSTGRGDVPPSLDRLLQQAMSKDKRLRPASAAAFARALQAIEQEMHLRPTPFKIAQDTHPVAPPIEAPDELGTRRRGGTTVDPQGSDHPQQTGGASTQQPSPSQPVVPDGDKTRLRSRETLESQDELLSKQRQIDAEADRPFRKGPLIGAIVLIAVLALGFGGWLIVTRVMGDHPGPLEQTPTQSDTPPAWIYYPPGTVTVTAARSTDGKDVVYTWEGYAHEEGSDTYSVKLSDGSVHSADAPTYTWPDAPANSCVAVRVIRDDGSNASQEWSKDGCA